MLAEAPQILTPKRVQRRAVEWRPLFLAALSNSGNVLASCKAASISRVQAYDARDRSPEFAAQWETAMEEACDVLEAAARKRAMQTSDTLLIFLLKAHRPAKFRETIRQEHTGANGTPLRFTFTFTRAEDADDE